MRYGVVVWIGDEVVAARTGRDAPLRVTIPATPEPTGLAWWRDADGPARVARLVDRVAQRFAGDELVQLTLLAPAEARPGLESALGFAIVDVDVEVVAVEDAVSAVLGAPSRVGEWRDNTLLWSGQGALSVVVAPHEQADEARSRMGIDAPGAEFVSAQLLVDLCAGARDAPREDVPIEIDDDVQFTVYRPRLVRPETVERLAAFAHKSGEYELDGRVVDPLSEVARQAEELLGDLSGQVRTVQDSEASIARGDVLRFVPVAAGIRFNPEALEFQWLRGVHREVFEFVAPWELDGQTVSGRLSIYAGVRLVADVPLRIRVTSSAAAADQEHSRGRVYGKVFPSYSHQDSVVVAQIAAAAQTLGHEYLRDVDHLRAGQHWQRELERYIDEADVFQLFWSRASMVSPHVQHEWAYALSLDRPDFVRPVYWEEPRPSAPPSLPPPELDRLHFAFLGALAPAPAVAPPAAAAAVATSAAAPAVATPAPAQLPAPAGPPSPDSPRRGFRGAIAGLGAAAVAGVVVTLGISMGGGAPDASQPAVPSSSSPVTGTVGDPSGSVTEEQPPPSRTPTAAEAERAVTAFFAALDGGSYAQAMELVCPERQAALATTVRRLTAYSWTVPQVESNTVRGQDRVVVVSVSASGRRGAASGRLRVLVRGGSGGAVVCGLADA